MSQENTQGTERKVKVLSRVDTKENWETINPELLDREIGYERETGKYKIGKLDENEQPMHWNDLDYAIGLIKADTRENWESNNPILSDKEIGYEQGTGRYKIGDGIIHWNDLSYEINTDFEGRCIYLGKYPEVFFNSALVIGSDAGGEFDGDGNYTPQCSNNFSLNDAGTIETVGDIYIRCYNAVGAGNYDPDLRVVSYGELKELDDKITEIVDNKIKTIEDKITEIEDKIAGLQPLIPDAEGVEF